MSPGEKLKGARERRGLTQEELAPLAKLSTSSITSYETGKMQPRRATAQRLDDVLGAGGAILAAFGFATASPDDRFDVLQRQMAKLELSTASVVDHLLEIQRTVEVIAVIAQRLLDDAREQGGERRDEN